MYKLLLIWRYFLQKRVALLAVLAVTLVVMMVLVVLSIMSGLLGDTRTRNHRWSGDLILTRESLVGFPHYQDFLHLLAQHPDIAAATPVIKTFGLLEPSQQAVQLFGLRLDEFCRVTGFQQTLHHLADAPAPSFTVTARRIDGFGGPTPEESARGCIVGQYLLGLEVNDRDRAYFRTFGGPWDLTVFALSSRGILTGSGAGEFRRFWYLDDSTSGLPRIDGMTIYLDFDQLQQLCFMDGSDGEPARVNEIRIKLKPHVPLDQGRQTVRQTWTDFINQPASQNQARLLQDVTVQTWLEYRRSHIAPAEKEKNVMVLVFALIGIVAIFVVFAIFYLIVTEKIKDLGIIKSVGGSAFSAAQIFLGYGLLVGVVGAAVGTILGSLIVRHSNQIEAVLNRWFGFQLWDPAVYAIDRIPDVVDASQALIIALVAIAASVIGATLPAYRAARLRIVDTLRVE